MGRAIAENQSTLTHGRPAARLVPVDAFPGALRIGVAKVKFEVPDDIDAHNEAVARLFKGEDQS